MSRHLTTCTSLPRIGSSSGCNSTRADWWTSPWCSSIATGTIPTWRDVAEADCRHDKVHVHWYDARGKRSGETDIMPIVTQADVEAGMERASEMLFDQWEENLRRCMVDGR